MIELTDWLRHELVRRSEQEEPHECCGLISRATEATPGVGEGIALWGAENAAEDPEHGFEIDAENLLGIVGQIEKRHEVLVGVYHSHPSGSIAPSPDDVTTAMLWPGLTWIIIGKRECGGCEGGVQRALVQVSTPDKGAVSVTATAPCPSCGGEGTQPDFWVGVLA